MEHMGMKTLPQHQWWFFGSDFPGDFSGTTWCFFSPNNHLTVTITTYNGDSMVLSTATTKTHGDLMVI